MKNLKLWFACVLGVAVFVIGMKITLSIVADNMARDAAERETRTETEAITFEPIETETDIEFTPLETEETENEEVVICDTAEEVYASGEEVQPTVCEVAESVLENDEQGAVLDQSSSRQVNYAAAVNEDDVLLLARVIQNEAGADCATDEHQRAIASVVINRVADPRFPHDNIYDIIMCGWYDGHALQYNFGTLADFWSIVPTERAIANAEYVLTYGSTIPTDCVWQDNSIQGEIVMRFDYPNFPTTYICR